VAFICAGGCHFVVVGPPPPVSPSLGGCSPCCGVVTWPIAPVIHPASSGSQGWGRVLGLVVAIRYAVMVVGNCFIVPRFPPLVWL
jgi:hypothetical protein